MTRVVWWNMMNFAIRKVGNPQFHNIALDRLLQILNVFNRTQPDIFVMLELHNRRVGTTGKLLRESTSGGSGALTLLDFLNGGAPGGLGIPPVVGSGQWCMVPPIVTGAGGKMEGVGVYYRSDLVRFTGPWRYNASNYTTKPGGVGDQYPGRWATTLPAAQSTLGGQWIYQGTPKFKVKKSKKSGGGIPTLKFPVAGERTPWLTSFVELHGANRNLDIFSLHAPAPGPYAISGTVEVSAIPEFTNPIPANTIRALGGDFNVNANVPKHALDAYSPITDEGFEWVFYKSLNGVWPKTSMRNASKATVSIPPSPPPSYPGYGYAVSAYDQIFIKGNPALPVATTQRILNPVVGTDNAHSGYPNAGAGYGYPNAQPGANGTNAFTTPVGMNQDLPTISALPNLTNAQKLNQFRQWDNYRKVRSTSDHMAVSIDL